MASAEIFQYFVELQNFFAAAGATQNNTNSLESTSRYIEDHMSIIAAFLELMSNHVQQNFAERTKCIILEGIYESLREMSAEMALQVEADIQAHNMEAHSGSQRGRPR